MNTEDIRLLRDYIRPDDTFKVVEFDNTWRFQHLERMGLVEFQTTILCKTVGGLLIREARTTNSGIRICDSQQFSKVGLRDRFKDLRVSIIEFFNPHR